MRTTIDRAGRLVVPRELRQRLRIVGGETVELVERDGVIELSVAPADIDVVGTSSGSIARARSDLPPLTDDDVLDTIDRVRR